MLSPHRGGSKLIPMRRATFVLASGLAAAGIAGALVYHPSPQSPSLRAGAERQLPQQPHLTPSADTQARASDSPAAETTVVQSESRAQSENPGNVRKRAPVDEATQQARIKEQATEDVRDGYALLLEDLSLPEQEKRDLVALLIEMEVERRSGEIRGRKIPDQEKYERIAAVIGDRKLLALVELEQDRQSYWETTQIARLMRHKDVPLTEKQLAGVFDIVVEVHARYPYIPPPPELDIDSVELIEHVLTRADDFDRHIVELAPSVLSPRQVVHLFNAYEFMSRDRRSFVEKQKAWKTGDDPRLKIPGWMTPGRWPARVMRD